jgi:hypothetical protein
MCRANESRISSFIIWGSKYILYTILQRRAVRITNSPTARVGISTVLLLFILSTLINLFATTSCTKKNETGKKKLVRGEWSSSVSPYNFEKLWKNKPHMYTLGDSFIYFFLPIDQWCAFRRYIRTHIIYTNELDLSLIVTYWNMLFICLSWQHEEQ